ncbi:hypothetical protein TRAPUB_8669 [Trametes pubescens]|uniref:Uncharacterized protein n=1 Tax=Trametes pubescens TaxID=154538 RepID=A0A1M2W4J4_TRAPU|nr:hypothetical protein TRAPUB_8669 [Trametes pubescens]
MGKTPLVVERLAPAQRPSKPMAARSPPYASIRSRTQAAGRPGPRPRVYGRATQGYNAEIRQNRTAAPAHPPHAHTHLARKHTPPLPTVSAARTPRGHSGCGLQDAPVPGAPPPWPSACRAGPSAVLVLDVRPGEGACAGDGARMWLGVCCRVVLGLRRERVHVPRLCWDVHAKRASSGKAGGEWRPGLVWCAESSRATSRGGRGTYTAVHASYTTEEPAEYVVISS